MGNKQLDSPIKDAEDLVFCMSFACRKPFTLATRRFSLVELARTLQGLLVEPVARQI